MCVKLFKVIIMNQNTNPWICVVTILKVNQLIFYIQQAPATYVVCFNNKGLRMGKIRDFLKEI